MGSTSVAPPRPRKLLSILQSLTENIPKMLITMGSVGYLVWVIKKKFFFEIGTRFVDQVSLEITETSLLLPPEYMCHHHWAI